MVLFAPTTSNILKLYSIYWLEYLVAYVHIYIHSNPQKCAREKYKIIPGVQYILGSVCKQVHWNTLDVCLVCDHSKHRSQRQNLGKECRSAKICGETSSALPQSGVLGLSLLEIASTSQSFTARCSALSCTSAMSTVKYIFAEGTDNFV